MSEEQGVNGDGDTVQDYILGELDAAGEARARELLRSDAPEGERAEELRGIAQMLGELPADAWELLDRQAADTPAVDTPTVDTPTVDTPAARAPAPRARRARTRARSTRTRTRVLLAVAAAVLLLAVGVGVGALLGSGSSQDGRAVALAALGSAADSTPADNGHGTAHMLPEGRMRLQVADLRPTGPHSFYEVWLMNSASDLVPVASFHVGASGSAELEVPLPVPTTGYRYLDVSLQQSSEGTAHSGDSVLRAPIPG